MIAAREALFKEKMQASPFVRFAIGAGIAPGPLGEPVSLEGEPASRFPLPTLAAKEPRLAASLSRAGQEPRAATKGAYPLGSPDDRLPAASLVEPIVPSVPPVKKTTGPPSARGARERFRRLFEITYLEMQLKKILEWTMI